MKIRVSIEPAIIEVDASEFQDAWDEHCADAGGEMEATPTAEFILDAVQNELDEGTRDLTDVFESATITVEKIDD